VIKITICCLRGLHYTVLPGTKEPLVFWQNMFVDEAGLLSGHLVPVRIFLLGFDTRSVHQECIVQNMELVVTYT